MAKYKIIGEETDLRHRNSLEINGKIRFAGELLDESEFKPRPADAPEGELSELESLLSTKHIKLIE